METQISTTIDQSKRLMEAGLSPDSADMYYKNNLPWTDKEPKYSAVLSDGSPVEALEWYNKGYTDAGKEPLSLLHFCFPAWSLSRLIDIHGHFQIGVIDNSEELIEAIVKSIILLISYGDIREEYLAK